jgi:hypothetical protein
MLAGVLVLAVTAPNLQAAFTESTISVEVRCVEQLKS